MARSRKHGRKFHEQQQLLLHQEHSAKSHPLCNHTVTIKYTAGGTTVTFGIYNGDVCVGQSAATSISNKSDKTTVTIPLTADLEPNIAYELRAISTGSGIGVFVWEQSTTNAAVTYTSGYAITAAEEFAGEQMKFFFKWKGTKPTVSYSVDNGAFSEISFDRTFTGTASGGYTHNQSVATVVFPTGQKSGSIRFKFELTDTGTAVFDYCAALI